MRALSLLAISRGHTVTGSDRTLIGHDEKNIDGADLVVYTNAVGEDNCEVCAARKRGIPTVERAAYLGEVSRLYDKTIAVSGCHGKSTTAAMLGVALSDLRPTVHVGVSGSSHIGGQKYFITEACEYRKSFLHLSPSLGIILNVGFDHPDCYKSLDELKEAYRQFAANCKTVLVNGDEDNGINGVTFGFAEGNVYRAVDVKADSGKRSFTVLYKHKPLVNVKLNVVGSHNVFNALATIAAAHILGFNVSRAAQAMSSFGGLPRRFERKGITLGKTVISDYAHHPDEIRASIAVAKEIFPSVAVVFQPHTYSRTKALAREFADALSTADEVILTPIFAARESDDLGVSSKTIADCIIGTNCTCCSVDEAIEKCKSISEKAVIFMGAGDIDGAADRFLSSG